MPSATIVIPSQYGEVAGHETGPDVERGPALAGGRPSHLADVADLVEVKTCRFGMMARPAC